MASDLSLGDAVTCLFDAISTPNSAGETCDVSVPDTIVYRNGVGSCRGREMTAAMAERLLLNGSTEGTKNIVTRAIRRHDDSIIGDRLPYLSTDFLTHDMTKAAIDLDRDVGIWTGILQRQLSPKNNHNTSICIKWSQSDPPKLELRRNKYKINNHTVFPYQRGVTFEGPVYLTDHVDQAKIPVQYVSKSLEICNKIALHIHSLSHRTVVRMTLYLFVDKSDHLWISWCKDLYLSGTVMDSFPRTRIPAQYRTRVGISKLPNPRWPVVLEEHIVAELRPPKVPTIHKTKAKISLPSKRFPAACRGWAMKFMKQNLTGDEIQEKHTSQVSSPLNRQADMQSVVTLSDLYAYGFSVVSHTPEAGSPTGESAGPKLPEQQSSLKVSTVGRVGGKKSKNRLNKLTHTLQLRKANVLYDKSTLALEQAVNRVNQKCAELPLSVPTSLPTLRHGAPFDCSSSNRHINVVKKIVRNRSQREMKYSIKKVKRMNDEGIFSRKLSTKRPSTLPIPIINKDVEENRSFNFNVSMDIGSGEESEQSDDEMSQRSSASASEQNPYIRIINRWNLNYHQVDTISSAIILFSEYKTHNPAISDACCRAVEYLSGLSYHYGIYSRQKMSFGDGFSFSFSIPTGYLPGVVEVQVCSFLETLRYIRSMSESECNTDAVGLVTDETYFSHLNSIIEPFPKTFEIIKKIPNNILISDIIKWVKFDFRMSFLSWALPASGDALRV